MHLPNWQELAEEGRITLVAVCDLIPERVAAMGEAFGAEKTYTDYKKMLRENDFDIIDICTHNRNHCAPTVAALEKGAHVLVEKPMAMTVKEAEKMMAAAKKARRKLMVAQHMRFEPAHEQLKAVSESGELGKVYTAKAVMLRRRGIPGWGKFHIQKESLGGPLIDIGVHVMDLCLWLMGNPKPVAVSGKVYRNFGDRKGLVNPWGVPYPLKEFDVEDHAIALVRFDTGASMHVEVSWAANIHQNEIHEVTLLGDKAGLSTNPVGVYGAEHGALTSRKLDWVQQGEGHRLEIRHFTECVEKNRPVRVQPAESVRVQKIIAGIYTSSERNKEVLIK
jgi:predicted dehydrogenase